MGVRKADKKAPEMKPAEIQTPTAEAVAVVVKKTQKLLHPSVNGSHQRNLRLARKRGKGKLRNTRKLKMNNWMFWELRLWLFSCSTDDHLSLCRLPIKLSISHFYRITHASE